MAPPRIVWRSCLVLFSLLSTTIAFSEENIPSLFRRGDELCNAPGFRACEGDPKLPPNFCCPPRTVCYSVDSSSTLLCCPDGANCRRIEPITCEMQSQNTTFLPISPLKTVRLEDPLPRCGKRCCPHGYSCKENNICLLEVEFAKILSSSPPLATSTQLPTVTGSTTTSSTPVSTTAELEPTSPAVIPITNCPQFPGAAVAVGFFPGLSFGVLISFAWVFWRNRHSDGSSSRFSSPSPTSDMRQRSHGNIMPVISDPIPHNMQDSVRTDFLRQRPASDPEADASGPSSRFARTGARVRSFFAPPKIVEPDVSTMPVPTLGLGDAHAPRRGEVSPESTPRTTTGDHLTLHPNHAFRTSRPATTFSLMMSRAGFETERGNPYYQLSGTPQTRQVAGPGPLLPSALKNV